MSRRPKRDVLADATAASSPPTVLEPSHIIARIIKAEGNHLFSATAPSSEKLLVEMPSKLRNTFWIKRRGYVVVDTAAFAERDNKLGGEIVTVVLDEKKWRKQKYWPKQFRETSYGESSEDEDEDDTRGQMPSSSDEEDDD